MEKYLNVQYIESIRVMINSYVAEMVYVPEKKKTIFRKHCPQGFLSNNGWNGTFYSFEDVVKRYKNTIVAQSVDGKYRLYYKPHVEIKMQSGEVNEKFFESESDLREFLADKRIQGVLTLIS